MTYHWLIALVVALVGAWVLLMLFGLPLLTRS
jgi:hypothetical protein